MADLVAKQEDILNQLAELKRQILLIKSNLNVTPTSIKKTSSSFSCVKSVTSNADLRDVIINASPMHPPYSLEILQRLLQDTVAFSFKFHIHSQASPMTESAKTLERSLVKFKPKSGVPKINVRLIWKNVGNNTELLVSYTPIVGEVNLLRYLSRAIPSSLSYDSDADCIELDSLLDVCYLIGKANTKSERKNLLQLLNKSVGKSNWLLGRPRASIADLAAYTAIKQISCSGEMGANLEKWIQRFETVV